MAHRKGYTRNAALMLLGVAFMMFMGSLVLAGMISKTVTVREDSSGTTTWIIGDTTASEFADFDTSDVYDARWWTSLTTQVKFAPLSTGAGSVDSAAVMVVLQGSNDKIYWTPLDSVSTADSTAGFDDTTLLPYRYLRAIVHHHTGIDSAGAQGTVTWNYRGED